MNHNVVRFFQMLTVTSLGMGIFNTVKAAKLRDIQKTLEDTRLSEKLLFNKVASLSEELLKSKYNNQNIKDKLDATQETFNEVSNIINKIDNAPKDDQHDLILQNIDNISDKINKANEGISKIIDLLNSSDTNKLIANNLSDSLQDFYNRLLEMNNYMTTLTFEQSICLVNILGCIAIGISLLLIIIVLFGNSLIDYFKLEERFPKLKTFIALRMKLQKYYLILDFSIIFAVLLGMLFVNILIFIY